MKWIEPSVEYWPQKSVEQHIARVGRICYKSQGREPGKELTDSEREEFLQKRDEERISDFWKSGHRSMFRHGSCYFYVPDEKKLHNIYTWSLLSASPYIHYVVKGSKVWISTNMQFLLEHDAIRNMLKPYVVNEQEFIYQAQRCDFIDALMLLRMTMVVTTQISTSRELNRTSPNAIAEQSTRYVNMKKKGGVQICRPWKHFPLGQRMVYVFACHVADWSYRILLRMGMKPQDARGILPLDTYTVVAYTYNLLEWRDILGLRYHEVTGKAHPNAKYVAGMIRDIIVKRIKYYDKDFNI